MSQDRQLTDTVWSFMDRAGPMYASMQEDYFRAEMHQNCLEIGMESPIEDLFWIACWLMCKRHHEELNPEPWFRKNGEPVAGSGIHIHPQSQVGKYRVDFTIAQVGVGPDHILTPVIVELDGHDFHDKDKKQRSYEKARDRALVKAGYRVLHFTGSDVVKDPFACAFEALDMVGLFVGSGIKEYDPADPLSLDCE